MAMLRWMADRAGRDSGLLCFAGAGSYDHHVPAAVWDLAQRGEFMTAYTPPTRRRRAKARCRSIFEYQSMMGRTDGNERFSNASVYDGASGLGEAVLMARAGEPAVEGRGPC